MQVTTSQFDAYAAGQIRPLTVKVFMSFDKTFTDTIQFFELNTSELDGGDFLQGEGDVVQEWDKYVYADYSDRVISVEWNNEEDQLFSLNNAIADVVFDNTDNFFTPGGGSGIDADILPGRPIRILAGFGEDVVPVFIGLTEKMPIINEKDKTATFHCIDFLTIILDRELSQSVIYTDLRVDEILDELLQEAGLLTTQFELDLSFTNIPFAYFPVGSTFRSAVKQLVEADLGTLLLDEMGVIRYRNFTNFSGTPDYYFDPSSIINATTRKYDDIINAVRVKADVREVQPEQLIYQSSTVITVPPGGVTADEDSFYSYEDPVTSVTDVIWVANANSDGSGTDLTSAITIDSQNDFAQASKIVFENSSVFTAYITVVTIYGTPAKVVTKVDAYGQDDTSVEAFGKKLVTIENDYIQSNLAAQSIIAVILTLYAAYGGVYEIDVKGNMALQLNDNVNIDIGYGDQDYQLSNSKNTIADGRYRQVLRVRVKPIINPFVLDVSELDGGDVLYV